jgi:hypothetical protein
MTAAPRRSRHVKQLSGTSGRGRRIGAALGAVSAGLLVLSACDKPTPLATVTVGTDSVHTEAACYEDGKALSDAKVAECVEMTAEKSIDMATGDTLRLGTDPEIADTGWVLYMNGAPAISDPFKKTYRSFTGIDLFASQTGGEAAQSVKLSIIEMDQDQKIKGVWNFEIVNDNG